jgi:phosphoserine phosphatase RsbU/P
MAAFLTFKTGMALGQRYPVADQMVLGRNADCEIQVSGETVSREHARIVRQGADYYVEDLASHNGTCLDGRQLDPKSPCLLRHGSLIQICDAAEFVFEVDPSPAAVLVDDDPNEESSIQSRITISTSGAGAGSAAARLKALVEITRDLSRTLALDEVLPKVLGSLFNLFSQADRGFIVLPNSDGALAPRWTRVRRDPTDAARISRTIIRRAMDAKQAILASTSADQPRIDVGESTAGLGIRSMMCAPLVGGDGAPMGALLIDTTDSNRGFTTEDLEVLAAVAAQAAIAIENAQFYEQMLARKELERDLELAREVQASLLPVEPPSVPNYTFFHFYQPARHVGGDYFDYVELPDGRIAVVVADVVGKGVPRLAAHGETCGRAEVLAGDACRPCSSNHSAQRALRQRPTRSPHGNAAHVRARPQHERGVDRQRRSYAPAGS